MNMMGGGSLHPATADTVAKKMHYVYQDGKTYDIESYRVVRNTVRVGAASKEGQAAIETDFFMIEE